MTVALSRISVAFATFSYAIVACAAIPAGGVNRDALRKSGPYCGIYCLYAAMRVQGLGIEMAELLKPEYVGSRKGSSMAELMKAATDHGMSCLAVANLSMLSLRSSQWPIILHTKTSVGSGEYDHYVLFLGVRDKAAVIWDPPGPVELIPVQEVLGSWDGTGLILSGEPLNQTVVFSAERAVFCLVVVGCFILVASARRATRGWVRTAGKASLGLRQRMCLFEFCTVVAIGTGLGVAFHTLSEGGLLSGHDYATTLFRSSRAIREVGIGAMPELMGRGALVIDARLRESFQKGHIDNAVNIPPFCGKNDRDGILRGVPASREIVVYCQSKGCGFADEVAMALLRDGFENVCVMRGGWAEWQASRVKVRKEMSFVSGQCADVSKDRAIGDGSSIRP